MLQKSSPFSHSPKHELFKCLFTEDPSLSPTTNVSSLSMSFNQRPHHPTPSESVLEELYHKSMTLTSLYEQEEAGVMEYRISDHWNLLPFEVIPLADSLVLSHSREKHSDKNFTLMRLLALKQKNFIENYSNSKKIRGMVRENEDHIAHFEELAMEESCEFEKQRKSVNKRKKIGKNKGNSAKNAF